MHGFYQNCWYFNDYYEEIQKLLCFDDFTIPSKYNDKNVYFIHIRRGDYLNLYSHNICNNDFYIKAMSYIKNIDKNAIFYVFSDDIEYCKKQDFLKNEIFIENVDEVTSLLIMKNCRKGGICCNSTYSWWGGYLNDNKEKILVMPKKWLNYNFICDIYIPNSIVLDHELNIFYKYENKKLSLLE